MISTISVTGCKSRCGTGKLLHYLVGWWFVGAGVLAPTGAVHIDLFGIDEMLKFV